MRCFYPVFGLLVVAPWASAAEALSEKIASAKLKAAVTRDIVYTPPPAVDASLSA